MYTLITHAARHLSPGPVLLDAALHRRMMAYYRADAPARMPHHRYAAPGRSRPAAGPLAAAWVAA